MCVGAHGLCKRVCVLSHFSRVRLSATPWTVAHQAPLSMEILQARILEWVAMPSFRGSSQPRDQTQVSHIAGHLILYYLSHQGTTGLHPSPFIDPQLVATTFSRFLYHY